MLLMTHDSMTLLLTKGVNKEYTNHHHARIKMHSSGSRKTDKTQQVASHLQKEQLL